MAKKLSRVKKAKEVKKTAKKKTGGFLKLLEVVVLFGAFAAFLMKFLKGEKEKE